MFLSSCPITGSINSFLKPQSASLKNLHQMGLKLAENFFHLERKLGLAKKSKTKLKNFSHINNTQDSFCHS